VWQRSAPFSRILRSRPTSPGSSIRRISRRTRRSSSRHRVHRITDPLNAQEGIIVADCDLAVGARQKRWFDVAGPTAEKKSCCGGWPARCSDEVLTFEVMG
jgi:hypothetical protein